MSSNKTIVVVGSGPGIGLATATRFVSQGGFTNVALISRNKDRLSQDAQQLLDACPDKPTVKTYTADVSDHVGLKKTLDQVEKDLGAPEVVHFNAARVAESRVGEVDEEFMIEDFKIINIGCYTTATWALPLLASLVSSGSNSHSTFHPSFLITGGGIHDVPSPDHISLSMQKAAQVNFAASLREKATPLGVHVATVAACGPVTDDDPVINAKNVAKRFYEIYLEQDKAEWSSLVYVGDK